MLHHQEQDLNLEVTKQQHDLLKFHFDRNTLENYRSINKLLMGNDLQSNLTIYIKFDGILIPVFLYLQHYWEPV